MRVSNIEINTNHISKSKLELKNKDSEKDFLHRFFYGLSTYESTPKDILTANFQKPTVSEEQYFVITARVDISFSSTVKQFGGDQAVPFDSTYYQICSAPMVNEKNVANKGYNFDSCMYSSKGMNTPKNWAFFKSVSESKNDFICKEDSALENIYDDAFSEAIEFLVDSCVNGLKFQTSKEHLSYETFIIKSCSIDILKIDYYNIPVYQLEYQYNKKGYKGFGFATKNGMIWGENPNNDNDKRLCKKKANLFDFITIVINIFVLVISILSKINGISLGVGGIIPILKLAVNKALPIMFVADIVTFVILSKIRNSNKYFKSSYLIKKDLFVKKLKELSLGAATSKELSYFNADKNNIKRTKIKSPLRVFAIITFVLSLASMVLLV